MAILVRAHVDALSGWATLRFPYNPDTVARLKELPGSRWEPESKSWQVPLHAWEILKHELRHEIVMTVERRAPIPAIIETKLRPYQREGAEFLIRNAGALLTMSMRTGKSPTAMAAMTALLSSGQSGWALITYPGSIRQEWARQLKKWANIDLVMMESLTSYTAEELAEIVARPYLVLGCHYEILDQRQRDIRRVIEGRKHNFTVTGDEIHACKNRKAGRTKALLDISQNSLCIARWGLSGTPMRNRPRDVYCLFDFAHPNSMGGYLTFCKRYADAHEGAHGWVDLGSSNEEELAARLRAISFRVTREQVAAWLPKAERQVILCDMSKTLAAKYLKLEKAVGAKIARTLSDAGSAADADALRGLCAITSQAKLPMAFERAAAHLEQGEKIIVFSHFHETLKDAEALFSEKLAAEPDEYAEWGMFCAGGWISPNKRDEVIQAWKDHEGPAVLLANSISSGVGIDLSQAEAGIFLELEWVPADFRQAEDRLVDVHQGTRTTPPLYEYLLVRGTVDEAMAAALLKKIRTTNAVVGSDRDTNMVADTLREGHAVASENLGLLNTDKDTVAAAIASIREKMLNGNAGSSDLDLDLEGWDDESNSEAELSEAES